MLVEDAIKKYLNICKTTSVVLRDRITCGLLVLPDTRPSGHRVRACSMSQGVEGAARHVTWMAPKTLVMTRDFDVDITVDIYIYIY